MVSVPGLLTTPVLWLDQHSQPSSFRYHCLLLTIFESMVYLLTCSQMSLIWIHGSFTFLFSDVFCHNSNNHCFWSHCRKATFQYFLYKIFFCLWYFHFMLIFRFDFNAYCIFSLLNTVVWVYLYKDLKFFTQKCDIIWYCQIGISIWLVWSVWSGMWYQLGGFGGSMDGFTRWELSILQVFPYTCGYFLIYIASISSSSLQVFPYCCRPCHLKHRPVPPKQYPPTSSASHEADQAAGVFIGWVVVGSGGGGAGRVVV